MDPLESFTFLTDNLPSWMVNVDKLNNYTAEKQKEFTAEFAKLVKSEPPRPPRSPGSSTKSVRTNNDDQPIDSSSQPPQYTPLDLANKYVFATARRKRKNQTNSARSGASGPQKYRDRHMVVVWYDSGVQEGFESLVRNIASARNNLRKGKMSSFMQNGFQLPTLRGNIRDSGNSLSIGSRAKILISDTKPGAVRRAANTLEDSAFDRADKELEAAQSLCEVAAHQFLRDGDCQLELEGVKRRFQATLQIGTVERERLEQEKMMRANSEVESNLEDEVSFTDITHSPVDTAKSIQPALLDSNAIEVDDDSDGDSIDIDITAFRAARLGARLRS